jgi:RimJ/RimL family protein N-acetyltransferase
MITLEPVKFSHTKALQQMDGMFFTCGTEEQAQKIVEMSTGLTMVEDGQVIGSCGVIKMWQGVGTWWMIIADSLRARPILLLKTAREIVELIATNHNYHRFEVFMDPEKTRHIRFIEALGFTFEGRMIQHTIDRKDHLLYARTF